MGFFKWLVEPLVDILEDMKSGSCANSSNETVVPKEETHEWELSLATEATKVFRPQIFEEYIGQSRAKKILKSYINAIKIRNKVMPHILIHGKAGCGKTTLARIIANELKVSFKEIITSDIDMNYIDTDINKVDGGILFLDEIHGMPRDNAERLYTVMEDFTYNGSPIKQFTIIGATTELGEILKDRKPFYDRFKILIELEDYTISELSLIAKQYQQNSFPNPNDKLNDKIFEVIGQNCRATPRMIIRLVEATIYLNKDIKTVLDNFGIIKDGFTFKDLKILKYIAQNEKGVGLQGLASYLDTSAENYIFQIEPYLLKNHLIIRTSRGRKATNNGIKFIEELETHIKEVKK